MEPAPIKILLLHGAIVFLFGLMAGIPFWLEIIKGRGTEITRPWRVAHTTLLGCGLILMTAGLTGPYLSLSQFLRTIMIFSFIASGYAFMIALIPGALFRRRALVPTPEGFTILLFLGHLIGAVGSILGVALLFYGLFV
jgi:hypothetical protein